MVSTQVPELYHHGILGQKWGIRRTPEQLGHKKSTKKQKSSKDVKSGEENKPVDKDAIIKSGNVKAAYANRAQFTDSELQQVINRYEIETKVKNLSAKDIKTGADKVNSLNNFLSASVKVTSSGIALYNNVAKTANAFSDSKLPIIGNGKPDDKKSGGKK